MTPQHTMRPSVACISEQLDPRLQLADIPPPQSVTLGLQPVATTKSLTTKRCMLCYYRLL